NAHHPRDLRSRIRGCSSMAELLLPKQTARVRFPSAPPMLRRAAIGRATEHSCCAVNRTLGWAHAAIVRATRSTGDASIPPTEQGQYGGMENDIPTALGS